MSCARLDFDSATIYVAPSFMKLLVSMEQTLKLFAFIEKCIISDIASNFLLQMNN